MQRAGQFESSLSPNPVIWCPGWDLNPHTPYGIRDFKSLASANFATRARLKSLNLLSHCSIALPTPARRLAARQLAWRSPLRDRWTDPYRI